MRSAGLLGRKRSSKNVRSYGPGRDNTKPSEKAAKAKAPALVMVYENSPTCVAINPLWEKEEVADDDDEDDFFFPIDEEDSVDDCGENDGGVLFTAATTSSSNTATATKEAAADLALDLLEGFFFGGSSTATTNTHCHTSRQKKAGHNGNGISSSMDFIDESLMDSPTSTVIPPVIVCSCAPEQRRQVFSGLSKVQSFHNNSNNNQQQQQQFVSSLSERSQSLPAMTRRSSSNSISSYNSAARPRKSVLKQQQQEQPDDDEESQRLSSTKHRNVSFTDISVREYDVELSDHPSCSYGPPIQLGWDYLEETTTSVEDYEVTRCPKRRDVHELVLSYNARKRRLKQIGYKKKDIKAVEKEVDRIKRERMITEFFLPASAIDETIEKVFVFLKGVFVGPFHHRKQQGTTVCQIHNC